MATASPVVLITGGAGFLGGTLAREILANDSPIHPHALRVLDCRSPIRPLDESVRQITGDIRDRAVMLDACRGADIVFHCAAVVDWGVRPDTEVNDVNFAGTRNVIAACAQTGVKALVYTSSLDAIYTGRPTIDIDESLPYPLSYPNVYCRSKAEAERAVLAADCHTLRTVALRPADIYGEGDPYHLETLMALVKRGPYVRIGSGRARCQHVYVGNAAHAHLLAGRALLDNSIAVHGKTYFLTDSPAENFFGFLEPILRACGCAVPEHPFAVPAPLAYALGCCAEAGALMLRPFVRIAPKLSRFAVTYTTTDFTFTSRRAAQDFGFRPKYSREQALQRIVAYYRGAASESRSAVA